jgi:hypothetical protein
VAARRVGVARVTGLPVPVDLEQASGLLDRYLSTPSFP